MSGRRLKIAACVSAGITVIGCSVRTFHATRDYKTAVERQVVATSWTMPAHLEDISYSFSCLRSDRARSLIATADDFVEIRANPSLSDSVVRLAGDLLHRAHVDGALLRPYQPASSHS